MCPLNLPTLEYKQFELPNPFTRGVLPLLTFAELERSLSSIGCAISEKCQKLTHLLTHFHREF